MQFNAWSQGICRFRFTNSSKLAGGCKVISCSLALLAQVQFVTTQSVHNSIQVIIIVTQYSYARNLDRDSNCESVYMLIVIFPPFCLLVDPLTFNVLLKIKFSSKYHFTQPEKNKKITEKKTHLRHSN